ncbi:MAG TPA: hypothetical protein VM599_03225, partial [Thermoanaerobaculia bacterium]|nr:hypothetical protein [Thermoanaerobaculia bacterium]
FQHVFPTVSRDGRWLAYSSDESGRWEVYVTDFPESRRKWQVSVEGAAFPLWRRDGRELAFAELPGSLAVAEVDGSGETFVVDEVETLFGELPVQQGPLLYDMTGDGERFLILAPVTGPEGEDLPPMTLVVNWTSERRER